MKVLSGICVIALLAGLFSLPIGYYTFLRLLVSVTSVLVIFQIYQDRISPKIIIFGLIAIFFNPIIPVYLNERDLWAPIDIFSAILFGIHAYKTHLAEKK